MAFDVRLYFSGDVLVEIEEYLLLCNAYRLHTFAYPRGVSRYLDLANKLDRQARMIIDSGAFTSWSLGKPVRLQDLISFNDDLIRRYGEKHELIFIALDVIPGEKGRRATADEIAAAVGQSYDNFVTMQEHFRGRYVLPVFHSGEDVGLRNAYLQRTDYICLSMDQGMSEKSRLAWAQRTIVPGFKHHGLAATGNEMVTKADWFSVDSSSWVTAANMGKILWPANGRLRTLNVSHDSPARHDPGEHYYTLTEHERAAVDKMLAQKGMTYEMLAYHHGPRRIWNIMMWLESPWKRNIQEAVDLFQ